MCGSRSVPRGSWSMHLCGGLWDGKTPTVDDLWGRCKDGNTEDEKGLLSLSLFGY